MSEQMTIGMLMERLKKSGHKLHEIMNFRIEIGMRDPAGNFEQSVVYDGYPYFFAGWPEKDVPPSIRLQGYTDKYFRSPPKRKEI